jgi:hypothetical protein
MQDQPIESRTSNALGVRIPQWIIRQLNKRSEQLSVENQNNTEPNENILFRGNRSAWIRMVSSIDIIDPFIFFYNPIEQEDQFIKLGDNKAKRYFQDLGIDIKNGSDLAKKFILQGGTTVYKNENGNFSYNLRQGFPDTYNVAGNKEVENYGYRPMPGITSVRVQTQGKLGSIKAAEIQLKVWDKAQLDIIDALYFKLGYTMFLEWGHTNYYKENGDFGSTESYSLDPFQAGLTKEDIYNKISNSIRESEGNYDAMLGMVTNFNFTYNQEGGYDCTIKLISLGVLISNMKMNNPRILPELQEDVIKRLVNTLTKLEKERLAKERAAAESEARTNPILDSSYPSCVRKYGQPTQTKDGGPYAIRPPKGDVLEGYSFYNNGRAADSTGKSVSYSCDGDIILINGKAAGILSKDLKAKYVTLDSQTRKYQVSGQDSYASDVYKTYENLDFSANTNTNIGWIYFINRLKGFIPTDSDKIKNAQINLDSAAIFKKIDFAISDSSLWKYSVDFEKAMSNYYNITNPLTSIIRNAANTIGDIIELFDKDPSNNGFLDETKKASGKTNLNVVYQSKNRNRYNIEISRFVFGISDKEEVLDNFANSTTKISNTSGGFGGGKSYSYKLITNKEFAEALKNYMSNPETKYKLSDVKPLPNEVRISIPLQIPVVKNVDVITKKESENVLGQKIPAEIGKQNITYIVNAELIIEDSLFITGLFISDPSIEEPIDFLGKLPSLQDQNKPLDSQASESEQSGPTLDVLDIQKTEAEKYKSAFEVIIRTIQLYSLDQAIDSKIEEDRIVKKLSLIDDKKKIYNEFTKELFKVGLFSSILDELISISKDTTKLKQYCENYDKEMQSGTIADKEKMLLVRALFGFHFGLLGNVATATDLLNGDLVVNFSEMMASYTVPYEFNQGIVQGTQLNHPVYVPLGFVIMILNHMCTIYDNNKPVVYLDFNHKSNICLSNSKHLSTNPYDILIPFQGTNKDFESILEPTTLDTQTIKEKSTDKIISSNVVIKPMSGSAVYTNVYTPRNQDASKNAIRDRISVDLLAFKPAEIKDEIYRGRTMHILISCDYLLRLIGTFTKSNGSGDVYVREFIEQILSDINKSLGDINVFRLAYDDNANAIHIVDDQMTPNLENRYPIANETFRDIQNKSKLPLFGKGSIAKTIEIRTEISSKLSNMIAVSANANIDDQANLSKSTDSFGFYNTAYKDRYVPNRTEYTSQVTLPTDTMIRSTIQFNEAIKTFYGDAKPAEGSVGHATNYYIQRMSKIKSSEKGTRASAMIPVSLNFSIDGMSGFGMGQSFTIDPEFLPYTYNLSLTDPYGEQDRDRTVAFVMTGLDHTIEGNQWTSNVRTNMIYAKNQNDFNANKIEKLKEVGGLRISKPNEITSEFNGVSIATKKLNYTAEQIKKAVIKKGHTWYESDSKLNIVGVRNSSTKNLVTNKFDDIITVTYKEASEIKFYQFAITTDPGAYYVKNFFPGAVATGRMVPGQYVNAYSIGTHRSKYEALIEVGPIKAFRDDNKDDIYDETNIQQGNFSMNIHKAFDSDTGVAIEIDNTSAGCQVFSSTQDFNNFMTLVRSSRTKLNSNSFTYTLLLSDDII